MRTTKCGSEFIVNNISYNNKYEKWDQVWGEQKTITNHYNEIIISGKFNYDYGADYKIKFRNFNDGIALDTNENHLKIHQLQIIYQQQFL